MTAKLGIHLHTLFSYLWLSQQNMLKSLFSTIPLFLGPQLMGAEGSDPNSTVNPDLSTGPSVFSIG